MSPRITVLMPAYNAGSYIAEAVRSVLGQSFTDFELLVIDDGSTDDTPQVMATFADPRIRYVRHEKNRGILAVLNEGLDTARAPLIARMDADDRMRADRLERQEQFLAKDPHIAAVASFVDLIDADGERTGTWATDRATPDEASIRTMMPRTNCIAHGSMMLRKDALSGLRYAGKYEDWDLWMRLLARGKRIAKIPEPLLELRMHAASIMGTDTRTRSLERRLLRSRGEYLRGEWRRGRFDAFQVRVLIAQVRTIAGHALRNVLPEAARGLYRLFTYSPVRLLRERGVLREALSGWQGRHAFVFSYLGTGGAEQVHADIMATVADQRPLIFITGFSKDRGFAERFARCGTLVEIPRLLHHPFTAKSVRRRIVAALNAKPDPVLFGANTDHFARWLAELNANVRAIHLVHAFRFQPGGNVGSPGTELEFAL